MNQAQVFGGPSLFLGEAVAEDLGMYMLALNPWRGIFLYCFSRAL